MRHHFILTRKAISTKTRKNKYRQDAGKLRSSYIVGMNVKWYSGFGKQFGRELSCDSIISLLGSKTTGTYIYTETCTPMFRLRFFIKAKKWKQVKCPVTNG